MPPSIPSLFCIDRFLFCIDRFLFCIDRFLFCTDRFLFCTDLLLSRLLPWLLGFPPPLPLSAMSVVGSPYLFLASKYDIGSAGGVGGVGPPGEVLFRRDMSHR